MALTIQAVVSLDTKMFTAGIRGIEAQVNQFAGLAMMQFGGVAQQIAAMWGAFGPAGAAVSALGAIVQAGASYEQQMARVASYTQATGDTMRRLSSEGAGMAAKFGFSLDQVGQSMASLALAGVEAADMGDVLQASLLLASATLGDANQSAELITSTLKVFQADMAKAASVADLFAGAIASSPLDLQRLSDSMKYAGATGAAFGMNMSQVVSEIAAFHQVGLRGQMAGTSFRGALLEMSSAAASAKGVVGSALQGWVPATEGLTGAVRRLNDAGADASVVIQELGKRAGPGVAALMKLGADAMEDLSGKIRQNSSVTSMHEKQMEALAGQYKLLQGEIASLAKKIFDALSPGFRSALEQVKNSVVRFGELASFLKGPVSSAFNTFFPLLVRAATALVAFNAALKGLSFVGVNTGVKSLGDLMRVSSEGAAAAQRLAALKTELSGIESAIKSVKLAGAGGMIGATDTAALADLSRKAENARAAFSALQAQGAQPFIDKAAFAAAPEFQRLGRYIEDDRRLVYELRASYERLRYNPFEQAQNQAKSLAVALRGATNDLDKHTREYRKLEAAVRKTGISEFNASLSESRKNMTAATAAAEKFQSKLSDKSLKTYNATLAEQAKRQNEVTVAMGETRKAAGFLGTGLSGLQVGISAIGAAIMGWQIGTWIAQLRVPFTDHTIHEWLSLGIAKCIEFGTTMDDVTGKLSPELETLKGKLERLKDAGADAAEVFIQKMPQSIQYTSNLAQNMAFVEEQARAAAAAIAHAFDFSGGSMDTSGILVQLREMGEIVDGFGKDLAGAFDPQEIKDFRKEIANLESDASSLKASIQAKQDAYNASLRQQHTIQTQITEYEREIARLQNERAQAGMTEKTVYNEQIKVLKEKLAQLVKTNGTAVQTLVETKKALDEETGKLEGLNGRLVETRSRLDAIAEGIANARSLQDALNDAFEEWQADEKARAAASALDELAAAYASTGLAMDDTKAGIEALGNGLEYFVGAAKEAGVETNQIGRNLQWMTKNQEEARAVLERLGVKTEEVTRFMVLYGDKSLDVARRMSQLGESEEEAAQAVGVFGSAAAQTTQTLESNTKAIAENRKELFALASISGARLTRLTDNLKQLRDALTPPAGAPAIDLSWMRDLASLTRLPNLGSVDSWLRKFDTFATGVRDICTNIGPNIDFSWVEPIGHFQMPNLDGATGWIKDFKDWASSIRTETPSLERFATVLQNLQGSLTALNDATLKIVFKDESLLSRIESHLATLASLKGVIWA